LSDLPPAAFISLLITYATYAPQNCSDLFHHPYHHLLQVLADRCLKLLSNLLHQTFYNYQSDLNYCQDLTLHAPHDWKFHGKLKEDFLSFYFF
jgi:hypothetical protein